MMVNPPPDELEAVRDRALRSTDVSFVLTSAAPGSPVVWVNDAFTRTTGWSLAEIVGQRPSVLHGPGTDPATTRRMAEAVAAGRRITETVLNYRKDGTPFWNQVSLSPVADDDGVVRHWAGIQVDVTERVEHTGGLERSVEEERRARRSLAVVAHVSQILGDVDDPHLLREVAGLLEQDLVEMAAYFLDEGGLRAVEGISAPVAESGSTRRNRRLRPADDVPRAAPDLVQHLLEGALEGPIEVPLDGEPVGETTAWLVEQLRARLGRGERAVAVVHPIPGRRRTLGVQVTVPHGGRGLDRLDEHEQLVLPLIARRVGTVADNVRLYAREHRLAETLQRAMLPQQADVRDLDVWTYYAPSSGHAQVGGDWYDVLEPEPGQVAVVVGDVVGHDVEAAAAMGQLRSVVRSYAFGSPEPAQVLRQVDQLVAGMQVPRPASLVLVTLQRDEGSGGWTAAYSRAGHLPPLVVRDGEVLQLDDARGPMVGFGTGERSSSTVDLRPGDVLVLYTDGLIERRDRRMRDGLEALVETAAAFGRQDAAGVGEDLLSRLADSPEDDVAVVVVRIPDPEGDGPGEGLSPRVRRWSFPSEPASIGRARQAVLRTCAAWGIPGGSSAELVVSELVANAVLHGWGHLQLRLYDTGDGVRIEVEDANPAPPVTTDGHVGRVGGYGMRIVERLADWGWRPAGSGKLVWARVRPVPITAALRTTTPGEWASGGSATSGWEDPDAR
ncbi:MAG: SpoIIE family protein phosphatase [Actinotalea sp.]|nr:SpoIIE family protein phosphatase [Actinotalea sp.]